MGTGSSSRKESYFFSSEKVINRSIEFLIKRLKNFKKRELRHQIEIFRDCSILDHIYDCTDCRNRIEINETTLVIMSNTLVIL